MLRKAKAGGGGRHTVATKAKLTIPCHRLDALSQRIYASHPVVPSVGDEEVAHGIEADALGIVQARAGGRTTIPATITVPVSRYGFNDPGRRVDAADAAGVFADEEVSFSIKGHARRRQTGLRGRAAISAEAARPTSGHGVYKTGVCVHSS